MAKVRDLVFKNLTSRNRKRRVLASSEITDKQGVRSTIHRHFICIMKEVDAKSMQKPQPCLYVLKKHSNKERKEKFFCRIKGGVLAVSNGKVFMIQFMHSLKISLKPTPVFETGGRPN
ncbi:hypothetical protein ACFL1K_02065 [Candidatus Omnitrophota bacterium]